MTRRALVTGGAGFIGSFIVDELLSRGFEVRVLDTLEPQVHGDIEYPCYLNPDAELVKGDIRNRSIIAQCLDDVSVVFHQAAAVGVGQSMYQVKHYIEVNALGTANLLDVLVNERHKVEKVIVSSSMSVYGEGRYHCQNCQKHVYPEVRAPAQLRRNIWECLCPECLAVLEPLPTDETKPLYPTSVYAVSKRAQEELCLLVGRTYGIPTVVLRYFNVYGPRQALSNPYTGVIAIFLARILNNRRPIVFEDGLQSRDFVHVRDVVQANMLALEKEEANFEVFNVGTGRRLSLNKVLEIIQNQLQVEITPQIPGKAREGDIRHCYADITKIKQHLGFDPAVAFEEGIRELASWVWEAESRDMVDEAIKELEVRGLII